MTFKTKEKMGFTLIELLVVIAIIALLMAVIMPALNVAKRQAQGAVCLANIKGLSQAWHAYVTENRDLLPGSNTKQVFGNYNWVYHPRSDAGDELNWDSDPSTVQEKINGIEKGVIFPYVDTAEVYHCPRDKRSLKPATDPAAAAGMAGAYRTYSMVTGVNGGYGWSHKKFTTIKSPGNKYIFLEEADGRGFNVNSWVLSTAPTSWVWTDPIGIFHNDRGNLGFADGHGEKYVWIDTDTVEMAERQVNNFSDPDSEDLEYMKRCYPRL